MTLFQLLLLPLVACLFFATLAAIFKGRATWREGGGWATLWLATGIAIAWPEVTMVAARTVGIGRGADLVLYSAVVVMMLGFLMVYSRLRCLGREVTLLVRALAIRDAAVNPSTPDAQGPRPTADQQPA